MKLLHTIRHQSVWSLFVVAMTRPVSWTSILPHEGTFLFAYDGLGGSKLEYSSTCRRDSATLTWTQSPGTMGSGILDEPSPAFFGQRVPSLRHEVEVMVPVLEGEEGAVSCLIVQGLHEAAR